MNQKKKRGYIFNSNWVKPTIIAIGFIMIIVGLSSSLFQNNTNKEYIPIKEEYVPTKEELQKRDWGEMLEGLEKAMRDFELVTDAEEVAEKLRNPQINNI